MVGRAAAGTGAGAPRSLTADTGRGAGNTSRSRGDYTTQVRSPGRT